MKKTSTLLAIGAAVVLTAGGCGTAAHRIDPAGEKGLVTVRDVNVKDWQMVAGKCADSLLASGTLQRDDGRKTVLMIGEIRNETGRKINTAILSGKLRQSILASGQALTTTAVGAGGAEDRAVRQVRELENDDLFHQSTVQKRGTVIAPDMSLSGEIIRKQTNSGRTEEGYFFFHVVVTDLGTGLGLWEDTFEVSKQETSSVFGF